jgi:TolB protein
MTVSKWKAIVAAAGWAPLVLLLSLALGVSSARHAAADLNIDITRGVFEPLPIAILSLDGARDDERQYGQDIATVVAADLRHSGLFRPLDPASFIEQNIALDAVPRFSGWRSINAPAVVNGRTQLLPDGRLKVEFRLWDVFAEQQMVGLAYFTEPKNWRRIAHIIADAVYKRMTGEEGYFDTRIVYVSESGPFDRRIKRLAIMDQDGENHRFLTDGSDLVLTPRFSPTLQEITYLSYRSGRPRVYIYNIDTGRQEVVGEFSGMTFSPRFSADGLQLIMTIAEGGNSDVYTMDVRTRQLRRLTSSSGIDTSPSFAPDGRRIVFESDRGGSQQLYVMDADGNNVRRISYGEGRYGTPVWSPRGDLIAFTKILRGRFFIGVMRPDGTAERVLAEGFHVEGPTWAPNGRVLMYFSQEPIRAGGGGGRSRLYSVDLTGHNLREIVTPMDASDPAWSPLIP